MIQGEEETKSQRQSPVVLLDGMAERDDRWRSTEDGVQRIAKRRRLATSSDEMAAAAHNGVGMVGNQLQQQLQLQQELGPCEIQPQLAQATHARVIQQANLHGSRSSNDGETANPIVQSDKHIGASSGAKAIPQEDEQFMKKHLKILKRHILRGTEHKLFYPYTQEEDIEHQDLEEDERKTEENSSFVYKEVLDIDQGDPNNEELYTGEDSVSSSTTSSFQLLRVRHKAREVFGLYKLLLNSKHLRKAEAAAKLAESSPYSRRTILSWAQEFQARNGSFQRFKGGKYTRPDFLQENTEFTEAFRAWCQDQGPDLSVDKAYYWVTEQLERMGTAKTASRSTVARWMKRIGCSARGVRSINPPLPVQLSLGQSEISTGSETKIEASHDHLRIEVDSHPATQAPPPPDHSFGGP